MSSELRLKKLRGSGGFIMAQVSDDQQRKGNLGGPDLFLAPIGRLDVQLISKYFCNTCEKDYEGGPKIEFENPLFISKGNSSKYHFTILTLCMCSLCYYGFSTIAQCFSISVIIRSKVKFFYYLQLCQKKT